MSLPPIFVRLLTGRLNSHSVVTDGKSKEGLCVCPLSGQVGTGHGAPVQQMASGCWTAVVSLSTVGSRSWEEGVACLLWACSLWPQGVESQLLISVAAPSCQCFSEGSGLEGSRCQAYTFPNS